MRHDLPHLTRCLLADALIFCEPLAPLPTVTAEPPGGAGATAASCSATSAPGCAPTRSTPDDPTSRAVIADVLRYLGLARYSLHDPDGALAGRDRWEQDLDWVANLRVSETDATVEFALADLHRKRLPD